MKTRHLFTSFSMLLAVTLCVQMPVAHANPRPEGSGTGYSRNNPLTKLEVGSEISWLKYEEPNFAKTEGMMYGIFAVASYRRMQNAKITSIKEMFSEKSQWNFFQLDTKFSWGQVDYSSPISGTADDENDFMFEIRGVTGYDFPVFEKTVLTPYFGFGYRYLNNDSAGIQTSLGASGYERESNYFYIPFGITSFTPINDEWSIRVNFEYDLLIAGRQISHLEDVNTLFPTVENNQHDGYGLRGSVRFMRKGEKVDLFIEPFIRYWDIDDSEVVQVFFTINSGTAFEPANTSTEGGVKLGLNF